MANTNQYLPFATATGANVLSPAAYQALASRLSGFSAGVASSQQLNTAWRQSSVVASMIAQFTADYGPSNVNDDGNVGNLEAQFVAALQTALVQTPAPGTPYEGTDTGTANAMQVTTTNPAIATLTPGNLFLITKSGNTNTGPTTLQIGTNGALPVVHVNGAPLAGGDWPATGAGFALYTAAGNFQYLYPGVIPANPDNEVWHTGSAGGTSSSLSTTLTPAPAHGATGYFIGLYVPSNFTNAANATLTWQDISNANVSAPLVINNTGAPVTGGELAGPSQKIIYYDGSYARVFVNADGNTLSGLGAPSNAVGLNGDYWEDWANYRVYGPKVANAWPTSYLQLAYPPQANSLAQFALQGGNQSITPNAHVAARITAIQQPPWCSVTSGVVTISQAGNYVFDCQIEVGVGASNGDGTFAGGSLYINSSQVATIGSTNVSGPGNGYFPQNGGYLGQTSYLAAGSTIYLQGYGDNDEFTSGTVQITTATMNITRVG